MSSSRKLSRRTFLGRASALTALANAARGQASAQRPGLKIYIHWDMDGANGIFTREQAWYWEPGVRERVAAEARQLLTSQVNSLSAAALGAGVTELIVCDTHHGGGNFLPDKLLTDPRITYHYRSVGMQDGKRRWMPGLDQTVHALMLPGHHAKVGTAGAFLPHTWTLQWADFIINGQSAGEIGIETCYAGHWDIPLILVQGDEAACDETRQQFPGVVTAAVKRATGFEAAAGLDPEAAHRETARRAAEAIGVLRAGKASPFKPTLPMTVRVRMATMEAAAKAAERPNVRRVDDHTVESRVGQQCDVVKWLLGTGLDMA